MTLWGKSEWNICS